MAGGCVVGVAASFYAQPGRYQGTDFPTNVHPGRPGAWILGIVGPVPEFLLVFHLGHPGGFFLHVATQHLLD